MPSSARGVPSINFWAIYHLVLLLTSIEAPQTPHIALYKSRRLPIPRLAPLESK